MKNTTRHADTHTQKNREQRTREKSKHTHVVVVEQLWKGHVSVSAYTQKRK